MSAQLHSFQYATASTSGLKVHTLHWFQCTQTYYHRQLYGSTDTDSTITISLCRDIQKIYIGEHLHSH